MFEKTKKTNLAVYTAREVWKDFGLNDMVHTHYTIRPPILRGVHVKNEQSFLT